MKDTITFILIMIAVSGLMVWLAPKVIYVAAYNPQCTLANQALQKIIAEGSNQ